MERIYGVLIKFKRVVAIMIMISIIFTSMPLGINNLAFAASERPSDEEILADMKREVADFLSDHNNNIYRYKYKADGEEETLYAVKMPKPRGKIIFDANQAKYAYQVYDTTGTVVLGQVYFDVEVLMSEGNLNLPNNINVNNYNDYTGSATSGILQLENGDLIRTVNIESEEQKPEIAFVVKFDDDDIKATSPEEVNYKNGSFLEDLSNFVSNTLGFAFGWVEGVLTEIFNGLLLTIADGIKALIDVAIGQDVTIYKIIFGKVDKLTINFWEVTNPTPKEPEEESGLLGGAPAQQNGAVKTTSTTIANIVSYWYGVFRGIAIAVYLVMLLYIGVRILLSSTGKSGQKYKEMLTSWLVGVVMLAFYPIVMKYTVIINDLFIGMMDPETTQGEALAAPNLGTNQAENVDAMKKIRDEAEKKNNIALTLIYIVMLGQLIVLIGVYYKRVFMMAFLITIFPIIAGMYIWEKTKGGGKSSLTTWTKEYVILVLTQTFHAIVYVVLVDGAYIAFQKSNNWFIFMISVLFLFEAEKIIRSIFGMRSSANTIGDLATAGAAALATSSKFKDLLKGDKKSKSEDEQNAEEAEETKKEAKKNVAVNNALSQSNTNTASSSHGGVSYGSHQDADMQNGGGVPPHGGAPLGGGAPVGTDTDVENANDDLHAAKAVVTEDAHKGRATRSAFSKALNITGRAAGITLGATSGLAMGSGKDALANAVIGNELGNIASKPVMAITGWVGGAYAGIRMRKKIERGDMDDELKQAGFDLARSFDPDDAVSEAKARVYREALAKQAEVTRRSGKAAGEAAFIDVVEEGRRREGF